MPVQYTYKCQVFADCISRNGAAVLPQRGSAACLDNPGFNLPGLLLCCFSGAVCLADCGVKVVHLSAPSLVGGGSGRSPLGLVRWASRRPAGVAAALQLVAGSAQHQPELIRGALVWSPVLLRLLHANGVQQSYTQQADRWAFQLMQVADRFSNANSSSVLPSSAKVLALLAASDADDATVQQAAEEQW